MRRWAVVVLTLLAAVACSESPVERTMGPEATTIDSVAWRAQMAHRPGLFLSETMTDCASACTFIPTNYHCGGTKVECSFQGDPVTAKPNSIVPRTAVVTGSGALLCNSTMGRVVGYFLGIEVASADMVPIDQSDCGADNITFGGTATITSEEGIDSVVIEPMSPWTFPVQGGGTGIASAFYTVQLNDEGIPFTLSCTPTVVRGAAVTCTATKVGSGTKTITQWQFDNSLDGTSKIRTANVSSLTWTGTLIVPGTVSIRASINGTPFALPIKSNPISVTPRNWNATPITHNFTIKSPSGLSATPHTVEAELGLTDVGLDEVSPLPLVQISDGGPNDTYQYFSTPPFIPASAVGVNEAMNVNSQWYNFQYAKDGKHKIPGTNRNASFCGNARVPQMRPTIEAHERIQWQNQPNSHTAIFFTSADSIIRFDAESAGGQFIATLTLLNTLQSRASTISKAMDNDQQRNNIHMTLPDSLFFVGPTYPTNGVWCRFKFF